MVRRIAMKKLTDQVLLAKLAVESKWLDIRVTAIGKVTDQILLRQWAEKDRQAAIRQASVRRIADDRFLVQRLPAEPSASVRTAIIEALRKRDSATVAELVGEQIRRSGELASAFASSQGSAGTPEPVARSR